MISQIIQIMNAVWVKAVLSALNFVQYNVKLSSLCYHTACEGVLNV